MSVLLSTRRHPAFRNNPLQKLQQPILKLRRWLPRSFAFYLGNPFPRFKLVRCPRFDSCAPAHLKLAPFPTRSLLPRSFTFYAAFPVNPFDLSARPCLLLESPRLHSRSRPRHFAFNVVHSRSPDRLGSIPTDQCSPPAGFPAERIHPIRSIETRSLPALTRSYPHHFTFYAWRAVASAKAGRSSRLLHSGDAMANEQKSVSPKPDWYQCLVLWSCYT